MIQTNSDQSTLWLTNNPWLDTDDTNYSFSAFEGGSFLIISENAENYFSTTKEEREEKYSVNSIEYYTHIAETPISPLHTQQI